MELALEQAQLVHWPLMYGARMFWIVEEDSRPCLDKLSNIALPKLASSDGVCVNAFSFLMSRNHSRGLRVTSPRSVGQNCT